MNQVVAADAAIKIYPIKEKNSWEIKLINHERMEDILVGWRSDDPTKFDYVIVEQERSIQSIKNEFGIIVPNKLAKQPKQDVSKGSHEAGYEWDVDEDRVTSSKNAVPTVTMLEYDDENHYCLKIADEIVQFQFKDDKNFPKGSFWVFVPNLPSPDSSWSISDIDILMDPQIEFNEASNEERDYIRVGANQKFIAYNMSEFDPESIKTSSGQVIFVDSPDGSARFEPLATNVNVFPIDQYLNRVQNEMYDFGVPKVAFGASGADSGRSKAIDYQSLIDVIDFKRDSWESAITQLVERIQILGAFLFPEYEFFKHPDTDDIVIRMPKLDWNDITPITSADKIVNVLNKTTMGLPFRRAFAELGYRDVEAVIAEMKEESKDEELMAFRSKMYQLTGGILGAQMKAQQVMQGMNQGPAVPLGNPTTNQITPILTSSQNQGRENSLPIAQTGGTTVFSSPKGFIDRTRQNLSAAGR